MKREFSPHPEKNMQNIERANLIVVRSKGNSFPHVTSKVLLSDLPSGPLSRIVILLPLFSLDLIENLSKPKNFKL